MSLEFTTPFWTLDANPRSGILGRLILIHEAGDTFLSIPHLPDHTPVHADMHGMDAADAEHPEVSGPVPDHTPVHADMHGMDAADAEHPEVSGPGAKIGCGVLEISNEAQVSSMEPNP